jgi:hypothetical protein
LILPYGKVWNLPDDCLAAVGNRLGVRNRKAARLSGKTPIEKNALVIDRFWTKTRWR